MGILPAVDRAREYVPFQAVLRFLRVSPSRFHAWARRRSWSVWMWDLTEPELRQEVLKLRRRVQKLTALLRLVLAVLRTSAPGSRRRTSDATIEPVLSKNRSDTKPGRFGGVWALGSGASQPIEHDL